MLCFMAPVKQKVGESIVPPPSKLWRRPWDGRTDGRTDARRLHYAYC